MSSQRVQWGTRPRADGQRETVCMNCGHSWLWKRIYLLWPIRLKWSKHPSTSAWFSRHGWELGANSRCQPIFGWTLHLKQLKICFGPKFPNRRKATVKSCPHCGGIWWAP